MLNDLQPVQYHSKKDNKFTYLAEDVEMTTRWSLKSKDILYKKIIGKSLIMQALGNQ